MKPMQKLLIALIVLLALLGALYLFRKKLALALADFLIIEDPIQHADIIHVIAGGDHRTNYGISLYQQGYGDVLFFTGGWCTLHHDVHAEHSQQMALEQGVDADDIFIDPTEITSTYMEAERLKAYIETSPKEINSVIIVSDAFHMRRARWAYRRVLGKEIDLIMAPVPLELSPYQREWWRDTESTTMIKEEYLKSFYYIVRYQLSWGKLNVWLASLDTE